MGRGRYSRRSVVGKSFFRASSARPRTLDSVTFHLSPPSDRCRGSPREGVLALMARGTNRQCTPQLFLPCSLCSPCVLTAHVLYRYRRLQYFFSRLYCVELVSPASLPHTLYLCAPRSPSSPSVLRRHGEDMICYPVFFCYSILASLDWILVSIYS